MKKIKEMGDRWEREVAKRLKGRRQPTSGAFGTQHNEPSLTGDVVVHYPWWNRQLHLECKAGYGGSKSLTLKREWFEKVRAEAILAKRYPVVAVKFKGVTGGDIESAKVICINFDVWERMMKEIEYMYLDMLSMLEAEYEGGDTNGKS